MLGPSVFVGRRPHALGARLIAYVHPVERIATPSLGEHTGGSPEPGRPLWRRDALGDFEIHAAKRSPRAIAFGRQQHALLFDEGRVGPAADARQILADSRKHVG